MHLTEGGSQRGCKEKLEEPAEPNKQAEKKLDFIIQREDHGQGAVILARLGYETRQNVRHGLAGPWRTESICSPPPGVSVMRGLRALKAEGWKFRRPTRGESYILATK